MLALLYYPLVLLIIVDIPETDRLLLFILPGVLLLFMNPY